MDTGGVLGVGRVDKVCLLNVGESVEREERRL